jgi:AraC-like DNA-binding protein
VYQEQPSRLAGVVRWRRIASLDGAPQRVLPDGCTDLIVSAGALLVAGPDTVAHLAGAAPGTIHVGLRFPPGLGPAVFGVPASELRDQRVPLTALRPEPAVRRLVEQLDAGADPAAALEAWAHGRLRTADERTLARPLSTAVVERLRTGEPVARTAAALGLGERRLHRHCLAAFGYGPKTLARVLRMNEALALARRGVPFSAVAVTTGYADQAHLARDVRALAGVPLRALVAPAGRPDQAG